MSRVLIVGAGAVGQVFGRHLQLAGADLTFFVREKYRAELERGFDLYPLNRARSPLQPVRLTGFQVVTTAHEVAEQRFDQVYLTVSAPALAGPWLPELCRAISDATLVTLQPGLESRDLIQRAGVPESQLVSGMISFMSYAAPLPGETRFPLPGMAYWFPPLGPTPFSGPHPRTQEVVALLRRGGFASAERRDVDRTSAFPTAVLMPYLLTLEAAGWSFRELVRSGRLQRGAQAAREALAVVAGSTGSAPLGIRLLALPALITILVWFARKIIPLPLELFLQKHFTKEAEQTRQLVSEYIDRGRATGLPTGALEALLDLVKSESASSRPA